MQTKQQANGIEAKPCPAEAKWATVIDDQLIPMPKRRLKAKDILHQSNAKPGAVLVRDYNSPNDIGFDPDATVDLAEGNVFRTAFGCECRQDIPCDDKPKLAFVVDDQWEVTIQPEQTGASLRGLMSLAEDVDLLRDYESPYDDLIRNDRRLRFSDGPVFITRCADEREITIIVNGRPKKVNTQTLSFAEVVALAYNPVRTEPFILYTVSYSRGPRKNPEGDLVAGQTVRIKEGMVFCVTETDKS